MHITAGVYVNDNESGLIIEDIDQWLETLAPFRKDYKHHDTGEDNGDSHLMALLMHHEIIVPITAGKLDLGIWQRIFYAEFDGQRDKRVMVKSDGRVTAYRTGIVPMRENSVFQSADQRSKGRGKSYQFFTALS
jgi:secondary thiamine-phosphate synthase enzyme